MLLKLLVIEALILILLQITKLAGNNEKNRVIIGTETD